MGQAWIDFDAPDLATRIERLNDAERDTLRFDVIRLDREGTVLFYNSTEGSQSGNPNPPMGLNFYTASCMGSDAFRGRIERAQEEGAVDLEIDLAARLRRRQPRAAHPRAVGKRRRRLGLHRARPQAGDVAAAVDAALRGVSAISLRLPASGRIS